MTTIDKTEDGELETILDNVFKYLEIGEAGLLGDVETHREALKTAISEYTTTKAEQLATETFEATIELWPTFPLYIQHTYRKTFYELLKKGASNV